MYTKWIKWSSSNNKVLNSDIYIKQCDVHRLTQSRLISIHWWYESSILRSLRHIFGIWTALLKKCYVFDSGRKTAAYAHLTACARFVGSSPIKNILTCKRIAKRAIRKLKFKLWFFTFLWDLHTAQNRFVVIQGWSKKKEPLYLDKLFT